MCSDVISCLRWMMQKYAYYKLQNYLLFLLVTCGIRNFFRMHLIGLVTSLLTSNV
jgi:hypothetical protein